MTISAKLMGLNRKLWYGPPFPDAAHDTHSGGSSDGRNECGVMSCQQSVIMMAARACPPAAPFTKF